MTERMAMPAAKVQCRRRVKARARLSAEGGASASGPRARLDVMSLVDMTDPDRRVQKDIDDVGEGVDGGRQPDDAYEAGLQHRHVAVDDRLVDQPPHAGNREDHLDDDRAAEQAREPEGEQSDD